MAMFHLLRIRTSIDIFKNEKCKVTFGLEYTMNFTAVNNTTAVEKKNNIFFRCLFGRFERVP